VLEVVDEFLFGWLEDLETMSLVTSATQKSRIPPATLRDR
jgi:hypothetical protein